MFTGIVQAQGKVLTSRAIKEGLKLEIKVPENLNKDLKKALKKNTKISKL